MKLQKAEQMKLEEYAAAFQEYKLMSGDWNDGFYSGIKFALEFIEEIGVDNLSNDARR